MLRFRIRKKYFLGALLPAVLVAGVVTWFVHSGGPRRTETRNVLLISIDPCRADTLSCYGHARRITPNIDALARDGVLFTHAQSTNPITLPAHCSMLTGTIPPFHGVHLNQGNTLYDSHVTLAEIVQKHGYQTGAVIGAFPHYWLHPPQPGDS